MIKIIDYSKYKLKECVKNNRYSMPRVIINVLQEAYILASSGYNYYNVDVRINEEDIAGLFIDFYNETIDVDPKSLIDIDIILDIDTMFKLALKNNMTQGGYGYTLDEIKFHEDKNLKENKLSNRIIIDIFSNNHKENEFSKCLDKLYEQSLSKSKGIGMMLGLTICYIKALVKYIVLVSKYSNLINEDDDIMIIYKNLIYNDTNISANQALEKTYSLYKELYSDKFDYIMNFIEFGTVLYSREIDIYFQNNTSFPKHIDESLKFFIEFLPRCTDNTSTINNFLIDYIVSDYCIKNDTEELGLLFYTLIFESTIIRLVENYFDKIDIDGFLKILGLHYKNLEEYEKKLNKRALEKERDRLLSGNLSNEIEYSKDENIFKNIRKGEEFEIYLGNLYKKIGYNVSTTKKTGDQGADLIIEKNGKRTVIQAKYYSGAVGNKAVQEAVGAIKYYNAHNAIVITNSYFTNSAIELAKCNDVELIDGKALSLLRKSVYGY